MVFLVWPCQRNFFIFVGPDYATALTVVKSLIQVTIVNDFSKFIYRYLLTS